MEKKLTKTELLWVLAMYKYYLHHTAYEHNAARLYSIYKKALTSTILGGDIKFLNDRRDYILSQNPIGIKPGKAVTVEIYKALARDILRDDQYYKQACLYKHKL